MNFSNAKKVGHELEELSDEELAEVDGGYFRGLLGTFGVNAGVGPVSAGIGGAVSPAGPNEGGAAYGYADAGVSRWGWGVTGGATVGAVFGGDGKSFDDVVTGRSQNISFGLGQLSWNDNGFYLGFGPSGIGYSQSETVNLTGGGGQAPVQQDQGPAPEPQLNDWSTAFGPNEGGPPL